ncbi:hypothetical protein, partial [Burkholderia mallei]|uniref:hypothetical protein n=1 Tax=Burkholderia mallei TaxID=13373 RepID=UPI001C0CE5D4
RLAVAIRPWSLAGRRSPPVVVGHRRSSFPAAAPERPGSRRASPGIERGSRPLRGGPSTFSIAPGAASGIFLLC